MQGHLDDHWSAWFADLELVRHYDGTTTLSGNVPDQAALHGILAKVRDLGVTLLVVETFDEATLDEATQVEANPDDASPTRPS